MPNHPTSASGVPGCAGVRRFRRRAARPRPRGAPRPAQPDHRARGPPAPRPPAHRRHVARGRPPPAPGRLHRGLPRPARLRPVSKPDTTDDHAPYSKRAMAADCSPSCAASGTSASPWSGTTGAATSRCASRSTTRTRCPRSPCSTACPSPKPSPGAPPVRDRLVALVLLRPARQARTRHPRRPRRLVRGHARAHGRRRVRGVPAGHPRPGDRARDARGLPRRPGARPRPRRGRSGRRSARRVPDAGPVVAPRRPRTALRRSAPHLADWAEDLRGGHSIESGHHMAEEASGEVAASLLAFLGSVEDDVR